MPMSARWVGTAWSARPSQAKLCGPSSDSVARRCLINTLEDALLEQIFGFVKFRKR